MCLWPRTTGGDTVRLPWFVQTHVQSPWLALLAVVHRRNFLSALRTQRADAHVHILRPIMPAGEHTNLFSYPGSSRKNRATDRATTSADPHRHTSTYVAPHRLVVEGPLHGVDVHCWCADAGALAPQGLHLVALVRVAELWQQRVSRIGQIMSSMCHGRLRSMLNACLNLHPTRHTGPHC